MTLSNMPIILEKKPLEDGLHSLLTLFASDLSSKFSGSMPPSSDIQNLSTSLSTYLGHLAGLKLRRCTKALRPSNLEFHILRSRNPAEETQDENGKYVKGEKEWFRLALYEITDEKGVVDVQILAEGEMKMVKAEVLEGFEQAVSKKVQEWQEREKERDRRLRKEALARRNANKKKNEVDGKGKAKKKKAKRKVKMEDESEDEELDLDILDEIASGSEDDMASPQFATSQRKTKHKARTSAFDGFDDDQDDDWTMGPDDIFDPMAFKVKKREGEREGPNSVSKDAKITVKKKGRREAPPQPESDEYGYNSESGEYEGIRLKREKTKGKVRFQDMEEEHVQAGLARHHDE